MSKDPKEIKVFVTRYIPEIGLSILKQAGLDLIVHRSDVPQTMEELTTTLANFNAVLSVGHNQFDSGSLEKCKHLEIISQFGAGYDNIDLERATKHGIVVANTPLAMNDATADVAFGLMIATSRKMFYMHKKIAKGEWGAFRSQANLGIELKNKTIGVFGLGNIGYELALRCKGAYNMNIIYHNRTRNEAAERALGAKWVDFDTFLKESDIVSLHCALTSQTEGLFDKKAFAKMKNTSIFINTSRGKVHNEKDLIDALNSGEIWGAGLDVTNPEPMHADNPILSMENVSVLPHIG